VSTRHVTRQLNLLIDGRLGREDALKVMGHLAECELCTAEWDALRRDREALQTSGSGIDMRFAQKLLNRERIAVIAQTEPRRHAKVARSVRPHVLRGSLIAVSGVVGILTILYMLGEPKEVQLSAFVEGNSVNGLTSHAIYPLGAGGMNSLVTSGQPGWASEEITQLGTVIQENNGVRVSRTTARMGENEFIVTESRGRLPQNVGEVLERSDQGGREVFLLDGDGSGVLFASGDGVVMIDCSCSGEALAGVVEAFPEEQPPGVLTRVSDGMGEIADAVTGG